MKAHQAALLGAVLLGATLLALRVWPHPPLRDAVDSSTAMFDVHGQLLRLTLARDQQYRLWTPLEQIAPLFIEALLLHEDQQFWRHPGVNPAALLRAARETYSGGARQGGSTITMQLARLMGPLNTRSAGGKLNQIAQALWLEMRHSKRDILEAHVNLLPYGQNIQGVGAAALIYFGKTADRLTLAEALTLVLIPQAPAARDPSGGEPVRLREARARLLARWLQQHPDAGEAAVLAAQPLRYGGPRALPFAAPHYTTALLQQTSAPQIQGTLQLPLQNLVQRRIAQYVAARGREGIVNAAALLVDFRDVSVKALAGSANFHDARIAGQNNGTAAKRSPGSALKPFIYALALDQGLIHPRSVLKDAPAAFGPFTPENFDGSFIGPVSAQEALVRSRNIPAVILSARLALPSFYQWLRSAGISRMASEKHYGLALALGGGEVSMEELVALYAMLANHGVLRPLRYTVDAPQSEGLRLLSEEASFLTLDMLHHNPPPDAPEALPSASLPVAWKTGTSWGFRDAWSVGIFGPYVLAVWVGNFDGVGHPAFTGREAAAPLFFQLVDAVKAQQPGLSAPLFRAPPNLTRVQVCAASGDLPNADCAQTVETWFIPGKSPIRVSTVHRRLRVDTRSGRQACANTPGQFIREEVYEFWSSDLMRLYAQAGMPRRAPPPEGDCAGASAQRGTPPGIVSPLSGAAYQVRAAELGQQGIPLRANADADVRTLYWFADEAYVGTSKPGAVLNWAPPRSGRYNLSTVDDRGRSDRRELRIEVLP